MTEPMKPEIVLLAGGRTKDVHLPNSRLLTPINGQPLITRTIQQFNKWANVTVVTNDKSVKSVARFQKGIRLTWIHDDPFYSQIDMIRKGLEIARARRSIIVFGDVVWTDEAVATVRDHEIDTWAVYGRSTASEIVGTPYGEYFAIEVNWLGREHGKGAARQVAEFFRDGQWHRCTAWEWYRHMEKMPYHIPDPANIEVGPHWVEINDGTDDIDLDADVQRLQEVHREMA